MGNSWQSKITCLGEVYVFFCQQFCKVIFKQKHTNLMKKILLLLSLFTLLATITFGQEKLRTKNYTERPDTEPPYVKARQVGVKIKQPGTSTARTSAPGKTGVRNDSTPPGPRIPIKAKPVNPGASSRRKSPARRPGAGN